MGNYRVPTAMEEHDYITLEQQVFDNAGEAISRVKQWAETRHLAPTPALIAVALQALSSLPAGTTMDMGLGDTVPNMFVAFVGTPGQGKDRMIKQVGLDLQVSMGEKILKPQHLQLGSGEGLVTALKPNEDGVSQPVLWGCGEVGVFAALKRRDGSTLQGNLNAMYSGNGFGATNKSETHSVEANSYTAGLWMNVQPDLAGAILNGADDGFSHRFVWVELIRPALNLDAPMPTGVVDLFSVAISPQLPQVGFVFPDEVKQATRQAMRETLKYGALSSGRGHRNLTRGKLAAGLALVRSDHRVTMDDWVRAGVLLDYSDRVQAMCAEHLRRQAIDAEVQREARRDEQEAAKHVDRLVRAGAKLVNELRGGSVGYSQLRNSCRRFRDELDAVVQECVIRGVVELTGGVLRRGEFWGEECVSRVVDELGGVS